MIHLRSPLSKKVMLGASGSSLYICSFNPPFSKKSGWIHYNCKCEVMADKDGEPLLHVSSNTNDLILIPLKQAKLKVFNGNTPGTFTFNSRHLGGLVKFQALATNEDFRNPTLSKDLQNLSKINLADLKLYDGKKKIVKKVDLPSSKHEMAPFVLKTPPPSNQSGSFSSTQIHSIKPSIDPPFSFLKAKIIDPIQRKRLVNDPPSNSIPSSCISKYFSNENNLPSLKGSSSSSLIRPSKNHYPRYKPYRFKSTSNSSVVTDSEGFNNLGQTCYVAAVLQLLFHSVTLRTLVLRERTFMLDLLGKVDTQGKCHIFNLCSSFFTRVVSLKLLRICFKGNWIRSL